MLKQVRAGSWIYGSFSTWVGHPEKNRAWDLLAATRKKLEEAGVTIVRPASTEPFRLRAVEMLKEKYIPEWGKAWDEFSALAK